MDPPLPNELVEMIFIKLLEDPDGFWLLASLTRWSLRLAIKYQQRYCVKDRNLARILPRLARYMPNLEQLCVVPSKNYFHSHLSDSALKSLQRFTRLTYLDIGHADAPELAVILTTLTTLQCIDTAAYEPNMTGVNPSTLAHLALDCDQIRKVPLTSLTNLRRLSLRFSGKLDVAQLSNESLTTVTQLVINCHTPEISQAFPNLAIVFPNLASIDFGTAALSADLTELRNLTRLTAVRAMHIQPSQLRGVKLRALASRVDDVSRFSEFTCLTALSVALTAKHPERVNLAPLWQLERLTLTGSYNEWQFTVGSRLTRVTLRHHSTIPWSAFADLQRLTLDYVPLHSARELRTLTQLTRLSLKCCISLHSKSLVSLSSLQNLTWQGATDEGLLALGACSALTALHLKSSTVSGAHLTQLRTLRRLILTGPVVVSGEYLAQLYHLEQLELAFDHHRRVSDVSAIHAACSNNALTALVLRGAVLDADTMRALTQLQYLHADNCWVE